MYCFFLCVSEDDAMQYVIYIDNLDHISLVMKWYPQTRVVIMILPRYILLFGVFYKPLLLTIYDHDSYSIRLSIVKSQVSTSIVHSVDHFNHGFTPIYFSSRQHVQDIRQTSLWFLNRRSMSISYKNPIFTTFPFCQK